MIENKRKRKVKLNSVWLCKKICDYLKRKVRRFGKSIDIVMQRKIYLATNY